MAVPRDAARPLVVGWLGSSCPTHPANGRVVFRNMNEQLGQITGDLGTLESCPLLCAGAESLICSRQEQWIQTSNIAPREIIVRRQQRALYRNMAVGAGAMVLAVVLIHMAFKIGTIRCRNINSRLSGETALIKTEGEAVGWRIQQLEAIRAARATHGDFHDILAGLYGATPEGVTYSYVELAENGRICLRGQADSLSLPFLLPERLERELLFENAALRDAGQTARGTGSVTEFRVDCNLRRRAD